MSTKNTQVSKPKNKKVHMHNNNKKGKKTRGVK